MTSSLTFENFEAIALFCAPSTLNNQTSKIKYFQNVFPQKSH